MNWCNLKLTDIYSISTSHRSASLQAQSLMWTASTRWESRTRCCWWPTPTPATWVTSQVVRSSRKWPREHWSSPRQERVSTSTSLRASTVTRASSSFTEAGWTSWSWTPSPKRGLWMSQTEPLALTWWWGSRDDALGESRRQLFRETHFRK